MLATPSLPADCHFKTIIMIVLKWHLCRLSCSLAPKTRTPRLCCRGVIVSGWSRLRWQHRSDCVQAILHRRPAICRSHRHQPLPRRRGPLCLPQRTSVERWVGQANVHGRWASTGQQGSQQGASTGQQEPALDKQRSQRLCFLHSSHPQVPRNFSIPTLFFNGSCTKPLFSAVQCGANHALPESMFL